MTEDAGRQVIVVVGPTVHGVECHEAWRDGFDCPHENREEGNP